MSESVLNNNFFSVDSGVMAHNGRSNSDIDDDSRAGELRKQQMEARRGATSTTETEDGREMSLRERVMKARRDLKQQVNDNVKDAVPMSIKMVTARLLRSSWLNLIPSYGLTLFWINIHAFMRIIPVFSSIFCRIGSEWMPTEIKGVSNGKIAAIGLIEKMAIILLDIVVILILAILLAVIMMIIDFVYNMGWFWIVVEVIKDSVILPHDVLINMNSI